MLFTPLTSMNLNGRLLLYASSFSRFAFRFLFLLGFSTDTSFSTWRWTATLLTFNSHSNERRLHSLRTQIVNEHLASIALLVVFLLIGHNSWRTVSVKVILCLYIVSSVGSVWRRYQILEVHCVGFQAKLTICATLQSLLRRSQQIY